MTHGGRIFPLAPWVRMAARAPNRKAGREQGFDALRIHSLNGYLSESSQFRVATLTEEGAAMEVDFLDGPKILWIRPERLPIIQRSSISGR